MKRFFTLIVFLSLAILAFYWFTGTNGLNREELLTAEALETLRGKIYPAPESSPYKDFFIDSQGNLYGLEAQTKSGFPDTEVSKKIEEFKDSNKEVEIKGEIEEGVEDYGEKTIKVKEIKQVESVESETTVNENGNNQDSSSAEISENCQNSGGSIELRRICIFPNGDECDIESLVNGSCP